ncbi:uncharacterized protein BDZ99DRAFT_436529 [Mytilinidion resinicola]|uniref:C2H2-type domain-containing protein n=1 Tax=Mytilinidion resinicola TaxID=574789 RepID=A0A6A6YZK1_9PEZI|nr:uncharacterized protein BDZ99DRAFT_436529 [Mytilinidion resinicola]KAF2813919.1 hypothetical protein BDZ99DRAFT_436529 [Mytilinidion resinicola]
MNGVAVPRDHQSQAPRNPAQRCHECRRDFRHERHLRQHLENSPRHQSQPIPIHDHDANEQTDPAPLGDSDDFTKIYSCTRCNAVLTEPEFRAHSCSGSDLDDDVNWNLNEMRRDCPECNEVFPDLLDFIDHMGSRACENICNGCSHHIPKVEWKKHCRKNHACFHCHSHHDSRKLLLKHVRTCNKRTIVDADVARISNILEETVLENREGRDFVCPHCLEIHMNKTNLQQHILTHLPVDEKCWGCERLFSTIPGIIIHLESGACPSATCKEELNGWAAEVFQWRNFIEKDWVRRLRNRVPVAPGDRPFYCGGCDTTFSSLSALFQHCANGSCSQGISEGPLERLSHWLVTRLKQCQKDSSET